MVLQTQSPRRLLLFSLLASFATPAVAAEAYRTVAVAIPVLSVLRESTGRVEYNLHGHGSLAVEGIMTRTGEELSSTEVNSSNGDALLSQGLEGIVMYTRYTDPLHLSGFYWGLGVGYRKMEAAWHRNPGASDGSMGLSLAYQYGKVINDVNVEGPTGHARIGYRYIGETVPFSVGIFAGLRHYQAQVSDRNLSEAGLQIEPMPTDKKKELARRLETTLVPGIELGFAF